MQRKKLIELIGKSTDFVAGTLTDTILFLFFLYGSSFGKLGSRGIYRAFQESESALSEINYQSIKRAINKLTEEQVFDRTSTEHELTIALTTLGEKRIATAFSTYKTKRPWDENIYLIAYDISNQANPTRNKLRTFIKTTGGALLQESLWMTPYDPREALGDFAREKGIEGTILVSRLGKDGFIGNQRLEELIARVYGYKALANRYDNFIETYRHGRVTSPLSLSFAYYSILKDDPQLPFALEPKNFPGGEAYRLFQLNKATYTNRCARALK